MAGSDKKVKELLLYVALKSQTDDKFGMVKLNKILFFADFEYYKHAGRSITGDEYQKQPLGPTLRRMRPLVQEMEAERIATRQRVTCFNLTQDRLIGLRSPDLREFTADEIAVVDSIIEELRPYNASEISNISHGFIGWQLAALGETIPYESVFIANREPTQAEYARGDELAKELG